MDDEERGYYYIYGCDNPEPDGDNDVIAVIIVVAIFVGLIILMAGEALK